MISLLDIKKFVSEKKLVSLSLVSETFKIQPKESLALLEILLHKGLVKKCSKAPLCTQRCLKCLPESFVLYQWVHRG